MRIAALDIGTNSIHVIIVQVRPDRSFEIIDREKEMVRLGSGGLGGRSLTEPAMLAAMQALTKFKRLADSHEVDEILAAATSAVREARNGRRFLNAVRQHTGIDVRVISGTEEARLIHRAAVYGVDVSQGSAVVIDIGGGSVELTLGTEAKARVAQSVKLGVIRLTEQFIDTDPIGHRDERRMVQHITDEIAPTVDKILSRGFDRAIGTSGTILSLGDLALAEGRTVGSDDLRNRRVNAKYVRRLRKEIVGFDLASRLRLPGLDPQRADLAVAGSILLDTILRLIGANELTLCDLALREGLVLDYIHRNQAQIARVEQHPDVRRRSVIELAERCHYASDHAAQVRQLALSLFDQTQPVHGLGAREREWLEYAAWLHDIGSHISYGRHHRHSYYLIKNGDLRGFEPEEVEVVALVARYHRRARPKGSHEGFSSLRPRLRRTVKALAAILRVAEGLDCSHAQSVDSFALVPGADDYLLRVVAAGDTELELWAAQRSVAPLEAILGQTIRFETDTRAEQANTPSRSPRARRRPRGQDRARDRVRPTRGTRLPH